MQFRSIRDHISTDSSLFLGSLLPLASTQQTARLLPPLPPLAGRRSLLPHIQEHHVNHTFTLRCTGREKEGASIAIITLL